MTAKQPINQITHGLQLDRLIKSGARVVVNFHAPWAEPSVQMTAVFDALHASQPDDTALTFASVPVESQPELTAKHGVSTVPTFKFFGGSRLVERFSGADAAKLSSVAKWLRAATDDALLSAACVQQARLGEITLFMKGSPDTPRCGFSRQVVELLRSHGVVFAHFDVLEDPAMRAAMKVHVDWPTYPMLFARGRLVGGLDILRELADSGTLVEELAKDAVEGTDPSAQGKGEEGEKEKKMEEQNDVEAGKQEANGAQAEDEASLSARLTALTKRAPVMLFMKGNPDEPRCGFSRRMVELLRGQEVAFEHFDILGDPVVRAGLKTFSEWPTFPQLYARGKFVGGLDVAVELVESGMFRDELGGV